MNRFKFIFLFLSFFIGNSLAVFSQSTSNCPYDKAIVYFESPSVVISSYNKEYYCSDILYLMNNKKGNISLTEYKKLYPKQIKDIDYLRSIGITPDIFEYYIEEEDYERLSTKKSTDMYLLSLLEMYRADENLLVVAYPDFENYSKTFSANKVGDIVNSEKSFKTCAKSKETKATDDDLYSSKSIGYYQIINAIPPALKPVILDGDTLRNVFDMNVATINDNRALGNKKNREVVFSKDIFSKYVYTIIEWKEKVCKPNTLTQKVKQNSTCYLCPYIIMIFNEISYIFNYMYENFRSIIIIFLIIFGALYMLSVFAKGLGYLPFDANFSDYPKSVAKKLQTILIVSTIILVPPKILFSWTIEPIFDLTLYISDNIIQVGNTDKTRFTCNGDTIIDEITEKNNYLKQDMLVPPIVKQKQISEISKIQDSVILSKTTMGNVICFLNNILESNGRQMTMGQVLINNAFKINVKYNHRFIGFIFGVIIFGLYFLINLMISFYILDGLLEFLKIAIMWPFYVFGYSFPVIKFNVKSIITTAKSFGLTMINLSVFSMFNSALLNSFYFVNVGKNESLIHMLNKAIENNDEALILNSIPNDLLAITQFLFIVYCIYYIYSKLGEFAGSYGGSMGGMNVGEGIRSIIKTSRGTLASVSREKKGAKKNPSKDKEENNKSENKKSDDNKVNEAELEEKIDE